jgi:nitrite reductase/ring-hydroxylating ferredoxin subunit
MVGDEQVSWHKLDPGDLEVDRITSVVVAGRALCITRTEAGYGVLDNRCPHQGGPLGEGEIDHGYEVVVSSRTV